LKEDNLINKYDRFIITRSDFMYQLPHPKTEYMDKSFIWIPDSEYSHGYTDRHVILSQKNIEVYLNILTTMFLRSNEYFMKMKHHTEWNLEQLIKFHLDQNNEIVKECPYIMYSVRNINGTTRWQQGHFNPEFGYYIKYGTEYDKSTFYKKEFLKSNNTIDTFYSNYFADYPKIIIINLKKDELRKKNMELELKKHNILNYTFFEAIDGCQLNYKKVDKSILSDDAVNQILSKHQQYGLTLSPGGAGIYYSWFHILEMYKD
jgi:hypothetical protein